MKIKIINYRQYFIDNIKVNWKLPLENQTMKDKRALMEFYHNYYRIQNNQKYGYFEDNMSILKKDAHYNIRAEWFGSFWANKGTKSIKPDLRVWYLSFLKVDSFINSKMQIQLGTDPKFKPHVTIARVDIARNHKGDLQDAIPINHPNIKDISQQLGKSTGKPYVTGYAIGKRDAKSGTFFRAYDKRFDADGVESSLLRFKTINYIRKEWELKRKTLRRFNIVTPENLINDFCNPPKITEIIYRLRKVQDCIIKRDSHLYTCIHELNDKNRINPTEGYTMNGHEFNEMIKKDYKILLNKSKKDEIQRHFWNPFKQVNALIEKKGQYLQEEEMLQLINKIIGHYSTNELEVDSYQSKVQKTLLTIKKDKRIKKTLNEIQNKKKEINHYTLSLMNKK